MTARARSFASVPEWAPWAALGGAFALAWWVTRQKGPSWTGPAEGFAVMEPETGCDLRLRDGVTAFRSYVMRTFGGGDDGILRECGGSGSGHTTGRAWDWRIDGSNDIDGFMRMLFANGAEGFRRAGLTYVIYNRQVFTAANPTWRPYGGADPHTGHVHVSFSNAGADGRTSFYRSV